MAFDSLKPIGQQQRPCGASVQRLEFAGVIGDATACAIFFAYGLTITATVPMAVLLAGRPVRAQQSDITQPEVRLICASTNKHLASNKAVHVEIFVRDRSIFITDGILCTVDIYLITPSYDSRHMIDGIIHGYLQGDDDYKCSVSSPND